MSHAQAVRVAVASSETQFKSLLSQIRAQVCWACYHYHYYTDQSVIDDLAQDVVVLLIKNDGHNLNSFEHRAKEMTWLRVVVLHQVARHFKGQKPTESLEDLPVESLPGQPPSQEEEVLFKELNEWVEKARNQLTEREWELWSYLRNGLNDQEIAACMGIKVRTVQVEKCALYKKIGGVVRRLMEGQQVW
jgi:RNA polymerase sigma factor (sigma-70 family)